MFAGSFIFLEIDDDTLSTSTSSGVVTLTLPTEFITPTTGSSGLPKEAGHAFIISNDVNRNISTSAFTNSTYAYDASHVSGSHAVSGILIRGA
jgi:hypothetical protein